MAQRRLVGIDATAALPEGFRYQPDLLTAEEETRLLTEITLLPFAAFEFQSFLAKRRVVFFGWRYDFNVGRMSETVEIPGFLKAVREKAASFAMIDPSRLQQALVTEYSRGAPIGWHRDRPTFGEVVGISLLSPCVFRLRRKLNQKRERVSITAEPRSAYLLSGAARSEWEHSIPPLEHLRYSITFRTLR